MGPLSKNDVGVSQPPMSSLIVTYLGELSLRILVCDTVYEGHKEEEEGLNISNSSS